MVATPVWFAEHADGYYLFSAGDAGKVKRLRIGDAARVAPCDVRGTRSGDWLPATAKLVVDDVEVQRAHNALVRKYGWQMRIIDFFAKLSGRFHKRAYIRVKVGESRE